MIPRWPHKAALLVGLPASLFLVGASAMAQAGAPAPSSNAMINLVRLLVAQGTISQDKGEELISEATREAQQAEATAAQPAPIAASAASAPATAQPGQVTTAPDQLASSLPPPPQGTIRVPYIPQLVRDQIRDDIRQDVMREAKADGWASPGLAAPDWVHNFRLYGDLRIRSQSQFYSQFNSTQIPNFQSIISGGPLDLLSGNIPFLNTTADRYGLVFVRARLGFDVAVNSRMKVGLLLASGNDPSPISSNATLGGGLFKRNVYIHEAYLQDRPTDWFTATAGRMPNPFLVTDALFEPELRLDGFAGELSFPGRADGLADFKLRGGAFPLDFGGQNFPDTSTVKISNRQKWMFTGQFETDWHIGERTQLKLAAGYYMFKNISGRPSEPCALGYGNTQCSTDGSAAFFAQKGNTLFQIRDIVNSSGETVDGNQLLGLTQHFHVLDAIAVLKIPATSQTEFTFVADYLRNMAFKASNACRFGEAAEPINNGGSGGSGNICDPDAAKRTPYVGGGQGFEVSASLGYPAPSHWGEWRAYMGYKYIESDAVLDAFTDANFHLGGTNAKGYFIGGTLGLGDGVNVSGRWLSANVVSGDPLAIDVLQLDLNVAF